MPILNYTTIIAAAKTVAEIQTLLVKAGCKRVMLEYDAKREPSALIFELNDERYLLPCRVEAVYQLLKSSSEIRPSYRTPEHAQRVAWRILKTWLEAQLAIVETRMVDAQEVMLPYMLLRDDKTVYENFREQRAERLLEQK